MRQLPKKLKLGEAENSVLWKSCTRKVFVELLSFTKAENIDALNRKQLMPIKQLVEVLL